MEDLRNALSAQDPVALAKALDLPPFDGKNNRNRAKFDHNGALGAAGQLQDAAGADWSSVGEHWWNACRAVAVEGDAVACYDHQSSLHASFNQVYGSSAGNWLVPALKTICRNTHLVAVHAGKQLSQKTRKRSKNQQHQAMAVKEDHSKLQNAVMLLQESFGKSFNDRREMRPNAPYNMEGSKKAGTLYIVNELFSIYFRLNTLRLCRNLLRPVETRKLHEIENNNMGEMVTYRYYVGRLNLFEDQYNEAEINLQYALTNCHRLAKHNKQRILRYLIPVKLIRGKLPSAQLLEKYELHEFVPLVDSIRKGNLRTFNDTLIEFQDRFIRQGTYLLLEKCKTLCYRNLFKRIHMVLDQKPQVPLSHVANAFKWLGMPIDLDEVECIIANLIFRGYVRGYLSHAKRVLVLSKRDPFPVSAFVAKS